MNHTKVLWVFFFLVPFAVCRQVPSNKGTLVKKSELFVNYSAPKNLQVLGKNQECDCRPPAWKNIKRVSLKSLEAKSDLKNKLFKHINSQCNHGPNKEKLNNWLAEKATFLKQLVKELIQGPKELFRNKERQKVLCKRYPTLCKVITAKVNLAKKLRDKFWKNFNSRRNNYDDDEADDNEDEDDEDDDDKNDEDDEDDNYEFEDDDDDDDQDDEDDDEDDENDKKK